MFKVINPNDQPYYRGRIDLLMGMMHHFQEVPLTLEEQKISTFIIAEVDCQKTAVPKTSPVRGDVLHEESLDNLLTHDFSSEDDVLSENEVLSEGDIYGGALLYQRDISDLPPRFQHFVEASRPILPTSPLNGAPLSEKSLIWGSTTSFFMNPNQRHPLNRNELDGCQRFYKDLLEKFMEFGQQAKTDFLYLTLCPFEYERTKNKGFWPYILEIKPDDSPDGLFYGILLLSKKQKDKRYKQMQEKKSFLPQPLQWAA